MKKIILIAVIFTTGILACKKEKADTKTVSDVVTTPASDTLGKGDFTGQQHNLSGKTILYKDNTGNHILRLENFNMTAAPDAHVFLSKTSTYSTGNILKVSDLTQNVNYTNSAINIDVAEDIDFTQYKYVIVWCTQYSAFFGSAPLN
jgi:hypothetical protein